MSEAPRRSPAAATAPWYVEGLRFECRPDCGACCINHGDSTCVYVDDDEQQGLAALLELDLADFRARYTRDEDGDRALLDEGDACVFLVEKKCTVYAARPRQCRTFPFWPENLTSRRKWSGLATFCPGIDEGAAHPVEEIRLRLAEHQEE